MTESKSARNSENVYPQYYCELKNQGYCHRHNPFELFEKEYDRGLLQPFEEVPYFCPKQEAMFLGVVMEISDENKVKVLTMAGEKGVRVKVKMSLDLFEQSKNAIRVSTFMIFEARKIYSKTKDIILKMVKVDICRNSDAGILEFVEKKRG